jgi:hypothetical protein
MSFLGRLPYALLGFWQTPAYALLQLEQLKDQLTLPGGC